MDGWKKGWKGISTINMQRCRLFALANNVLFSGIGRSFSIKTLSAQFINIVLQEENVILPEKYISAIV